ncbi:ATP transmembrane transporter [Aureococcus anophagefferens]|nr:ATP transmembrane transporter [Aureococcus anophagefferens]
MGFFTKAKATKHERLSDANVKKLFDQYDVDHSGTLDHEEMVAALASLHLPKYLAERAWHLCDRDHSGSVSLAQFTDFIHHQEEQIEVVFDEIDVDGSGMLSRQELDTWLHAHHVRATPEDEAHLEELFHPGKNATGEISYDEFRHALLFLNPTDFALFADDWMHYASADDLGTSHASTHPTTKATTKGPPTWLNGLAGAISAAISRTAEGVKAFWRGNGVNMIRIFPQNGLMFFAKPAIGKKMKAFVPDPFYGSMLSGMAAGCVSASAIYPLDVVRLRMTTTPGLYKGVIDGFKTIAAKEGPAALFRGIAYANLWAVPYTGALFATADFLKAQYSKRTGSKPTALVGVAVGAVAGAVSTTVGFPLESARRKMQAQGTGGRPVLYSSIWGCIAGTVKTGGVGALYTGCAANVVKMAPAQAITFGCMTVIVPALTDALV